jgi:hypothetical protein
MQLNHAQLIRQASETIDSEIEIYADYSGRGMMGNSTAGVTGDKSSIIAAMVYAAFEIGRSGGDVDEFMVDIHRLRWDNMGRSDVIAY